MASNRIKGITIEIDGNTTPLTKSLKDVDKSLKDTQSELKDVNKLLKLDPSNVELLRQKNGLLKDAIDKTKERQAKLVEALEQAKKAGDTEENRKQQDALQRELIETTQQLQGLEKEMSGAAGPTNEVAGSLDKADKSASVFSETLKSKLTGEAIIGAVKKLGGALKELSFGAITLSDDLQTQADKTGLSTDALQEYAYMAELVDTDVDTITGSLAKLTKKMSSAKDGTGSAAEAFDKLGVNVTDTNGDLRDNQDVFNDIIDALGGIENETERDAIAMEVFGKSAQELNPLIKAGSKQIKAYAKEAHSMGYVMSKDVIKQNVKASDALAKMKNAVQGAKNEIGSALAPVIKDVAEWLTKFIQKLRDNKETLEKLAKIIGVVTAAFVAFTIVQKVSAALTALKTATGAATVAQALLNTVMNMNPFALVAAAIAAVTTALFLFAGDAKDDTVSASDEIKAELDEMQAKLDANAEEWDAVNEAKAKALTEGESETNYYQTLWQELQDIVDENGNVKKGYEDRAAFITSTLAEALGIEIEMTDGQIKNYQTLQKEIDGLIQKRRAEIQLQAGEEAYKKAILERDEATKNLIETGTKYANATSRIKELDEEYALAKSDWDTRLAQTSYNYADAAAQAALQRMNAAADEKADLEANLDQMRSEYEQAEERVKENAYNIAQYEANLAAVHQEEYDKINTVTYETAKAYETMGEEEKKATQSVYGDLIDQAVKQYNAGKNIGENLLQGVLDGTKNNAIKTKAYGEIQTFASGLTNTMKRTLQVKSPSKVTEQIGKYFVEGFGVGVEDEEQGAYRDVAAFGTNTIATLQRSVAGGATANVGLTSTGANALINGKSTGAAVGGVNVSVVVNGNVDNYEQLANVIGQKLQQQMARQERAAFA